MVKIRSVPGFSGYAVSRDGRVWSRRLSRTGRLGRHWKQLRGKDNKGYPRVCLYRDDGTMRELGIHQVVLLTFVGPPPEGQETRHLNGISTDNRLENLCYGTRKRNAEDCVEHGTQPHGEEHGKSKLSEEQVREILRLHAEEGARGVDLAEMFSISEPTISLILSGKTWTHLLRPEILVPRKRRRLAPAAKVAMEHVEEIRKLYAEGWLQRELAEKYGISQSNVSKIVSGISWPDPK